MTKNITLALDEDVLDEVRVYAAKRNTTVNGLVRNYLTSIARQEDRTARARQRLVELMDQSNAEIGPIGWTRDELHDR